MDEKTRVALYELAAREARFNVWLGWDRARHFLATGAGLLGASVALLSFAASPAGEALVAALLAFGACHAFAGAHVVAVGHDYVRAARDKLVAHEKGLGLYDNPEHARLALATTPGKAEATARLAGALVTAAPRRALGTVTDQVRRLLWLVALLDAGGCVTLVVRLAWTRVR